MRIIANAALRKAINGAWATLLTLAGLYAAGIASPALAYSDNELATGFFRTVFGAEYKSWGWRSDTVKKFTRPVRVYIDNRSAKDRTAEVMRFVRSLPSSIRGLELEIVSEPAAANFRVYIVDRNQ